MQEQRKWEHARHACSWLLRLECGSRGRLPQLKNVTFGKAHSIALSDAQRLHGKDYNNTCPPSQACCDPKNVRLRWLRERRLFERESLGRKGRDSFACQAMAVMELVEAPAPTQPLGARTHRRAQGHPTAPFILPPFEHAEGRPGTNRDSAQRTKRHDKRGRTRGDAPMRPCQTDGFDVGHPATGDGVLCRFALLGQAHHPGYRRYGRRGSSTSSPTATSITTTTGGPGTGQHGLHWNAEEARSLLRSGMK
jgi:hypothetical protein